MNHMDGFAEWEKAAFGGPETISDQEIKDYLQSQGLDWQTAPYPSAQAVMKHWGVSYNVAYDMLSNLR